MLCDHTADYLLDKKVKIFQPVNGYRASSDAVLLSAAIPESFKKGKIKILDVGAGTGAISLCLAARLADTACIYGIEIQPELAELANYSAQQNGFNNLSFITADIRAKLPENILSPCSFDVVVSNPPYSEHDMPSPNQSKATAHNHQNFGLTEWLNFCLKMCKPFGYIYMVNRAESLPQICTSLQNKAGGITVLPIYSKQGQNAKRIILRAQKDSKAPCVFLPPFYVHQNDGQYSDLAQKILRQGLSFGNLGLSI